MLALHQEQHLRDCSHSSAYPDAPRRVRACSQRQCNPDTADPTSHTSFLGACWNARFTQALGLRERDGVQHRVELEGRMRRARVACTRRARIPWNEHRANEDARARRRVPPAPRRGAVCVSQLRRRVRRRRAVRPADALRTPEAPQPTATGRRLLATQPTIKQMMCMDYGHPDSIVHLRTAKRKGSCAHPGET